MAQETDTPAPQITCRPEGHIAVCPTCSEEVEVPTFDIPFLDATGAQRGFTTHHDLIAFEEHYREAHS